MMMPAYYLLKVNDLSNFSYGPMNGISFLDGIQTNHGSRAGQLKFERVQDFRNFVERIYNYGHQVNNEPV